MSPSCACVGFVFVCYIFLYLYVWIFWAPATCLKLSTVPGASSPASPLSQCLALPDTVFVGSWEGWLDNQPSCTKTQVTHEVWCQKILMWKISLVAWNQNFRLEEEKKSAQVLDFGNPDWVQVSLRATGDSWPSWGKWKCFLRGPSRSSFNPQFPLPPTRGSLLWLCLCVCSSHLVWESAGKHQCVSFLLFCPTPLPIPSAPASLTCLPPPLTLSSSPLDQTIHFSGHMESVQSSLMLLLLLVWVQNAVASLPI